MRPGEARGSASHAHARGDDEASLFSTVQRPHLPPQPVRSITMPALGQRMRKLQAKLLSIRLGSGAYVLPQDVKRIHMRFAKRLEGGHMGPR